MAMHLPENHPLQGGKYHVRQVIGQGGFGITYRGVWTTVVSGPMGDMATEVEVAIKEFFFADYCSRKEGDSHVSVTSATGGEVFVQFKNKLLKEAQILSRLRHPNIVSVLDVFEENGTAYMVMEFVTGDTLKEMIKRRGRLTEAETLGYASQLLEAVAEIHRHNVLHLDIKPGNILIDQSDKVRIIDFGIAKQYDDNHSETSTSPIGISKGFAPPEQYSGVRNFAPETDIYSVGATIYNMLTGVVPPEATTLIEEPLRPVSDYAPDVSPRTCMAVEKAMSMRKSDRPSSAAMMYDLLCNDADRSCKSEDTRIFERDAASSFADDEELTRTGPGISDDNGYIGSGPAAVCDDTDGEKDRQERKSRWPLVLVVLLVLAALGAGIYYIGYSRNEDLDRSRENMEDWSDDDSDGSDAFSIKELFDESVDPVAEAYGDTVVVNDSLFMRSYQSTAPVYDSLDIETPLRSGRYRDPENSADESREYNDSIFTAVEQQPSFPGGETALYRWLGEHMVYPSDAAEENVQGRVVVKFVIGKDGSIGNVKVVRGRHPSLDKEAVRVVRSMPRWSPGKQKGNAVRVWYTIPINFILQN